MSGYGERGQSKPPSETAVARYLVAKGWTNVDSLGNLATIWRRPARDESSTEIVLPRDGAVRDFAQRMSDVFDNLSEFESRDRSEIEESISLLSVDLISVQVTHADVESGSIPLDDGVLLNERARDLMTSAVLSTLSKRRHFHGQRPPEAAEYLKQLRLGQTRHGSYVINVICPLSGVDSPQSDLDARPFARYVTNTLWSALSALSGAIDRFNASGDAGVFGPTVDRGVSANMCNALLGFSGSDYARAFSIAISPSPAEPDQANEHRQFLFDHNSVATLRVAVEYFKDHYVLPDFQVLGIVKRLDREPTDEAGEVSIHAVISEGEEKNVSVELSAKDYLEAIHAHEHKLVVHCEGDLHVTPRTAKLLNARNFRLVSARLL